jgi:hypothetical protein
MNKENLDLLTIDFIRVVHIFEDRDKALLWFTTKNPHLGECAPVLLYMMNRGHKVTSFIESKLNGE